MAVPEKLERLAGTWKGKNRLNLSWMPDPIKESLSTASVKSRIDGTSIEIEYDWEFEGKPQEGLILIACSAKDETAHAVWTDSWHSANQLMYCEGSINNGGALNIRGSYTVEGHPDWGWRTEILPQDDGFKYRMFNVSPEGQEEWAVEMEFLRA